MTDRSHGRHKESRRLLLPVGAIVLPLFLVSLLAASVGAAESNLTAPGLGRIEGRVIDGATRAPLERINVTVAQSPLGTTTRTDGSYRLDAVPPGTYRLQFSAIGYRPEVRTDVVVSAGSPTRVDEELVPAPVQLEAIQVRPQPFVEELSSPSSTSTLRREEIRRFPGGFGDVVATVTALPGVAQVNSGGRNDLLVRGGGPSENLFVVNGLEVPNINHFSTQGTTGGALSFINLDFVDRVEFSSGGFGARYGGRLSSVLDLDLRPGREDRLGGKATVSATQYGLQLEGPVGGGTFIASARRSYLDLIFKAAGQPFIPVYTDYNLFAEVPLSSRDRLSILGLGAIDQVETDRGTAKKRRTLAGLLDNNQKQMILGTRLRHLMNGGYAEALAGFNQTRFDLSQADTSAAASEFYRTASREGGTTIEGTMVRRLHPRVLASGGAGLKWAGIDNSTAFADTVFDRSGRRVPRQLLGLPAALRLQRFDRRLDLWGEASADLSPSWNLLLGLRADRYSGLLAPWSVSPRATLTHRPGERLKLQASIGRYSQPPAQVWLVNPANRGLRPLRCDQGVLGAELLLREDTSIRLEGYYKRYRDLPGGIDPGSDSTRATDYLVLTNSGVGFGGREDDFGSFGYVALASRAGGEAFGGEVLLRKKLSEIPCYGQLSLGLGKSGYRAVNGVWYPGEYDQRFILGLSGGYVFNPRWQCSARFRLITGAPYTPVHDPRTDPQGDIQTLPQEYLSRRLGTSHQLDLRVDRRWNFSRRAVVAFLDIQNLYNFKTPQRPVWNFADGKIETHDAIGLLPSIGVSAEF